MRHASRLTPLPTRDPFGGGEVVVTRVEVPATGTVIEGTFGLGWIGRLTPEQLDLVGLLLERRNNLQRLAGDLGVAYNTVRARFEEVVAAVGGPAAPPTSGSALLSEAERRAVLQQLATGEISVEDAKARLAGEGTST